MLLVYVWELRKLGELGSVAMNKRIFKEQTTDNGDVPFFKIGTFGSKADAFITRELFEEYKAKYPYPKIGDLLISASGSIGRIVEYTGKDEYFQDSNIVWLNHDARIENSFLKQFYSIVKWKGLEGSTIKRLYNKNILETEILIPNSNEQQKIGVFFKQLDNTIALHQCKIDALKRMKKGFLQQMFPTNEESVPRARFADFEEKWEQRKLSELAESFEYGLNATSTDYNGENKYLRITDIDDNSREFIQDGLTSPDIDLTSADNYKLQKGDVLFARTGASVGKTYRYQEKDGLVYYAGFLIRARIKPEFDSDFVFQNTLTDRYNNFIRITSQRSGQPGVNAKEYGDFQISVPNFDEQKKIGKFFKSIDDLFTLHQDQLNKLKTVKKAYLQNMFI
ncbi:restriction endonuclease subunit S [Enterococcus sp. DIV0125]|uniref:restriction endonuclease subunit S n=1 Tax=Enterococcus sp. DIV0125 TaxID=2774796 RepID=UPI003D2FDC5F